MRRKKSEKEIKSELREIELSNAVVIELEEPKWIWQCKYIHYKPIVKETEEGVRRVLKKEAGTFNIRSTSDIGAMSGATSQLYKILNAEPGNIIVTGAELIGTVESES